ncbi:MAG: T9SS type A sorting domain-containing protein, partial [candidate division Zixibacteria bacterium]|nr:T9SS type A sorting domain-containing protein [candidate division Zixibacteria bacterium]
YWPDFKRTTDDVMSFLYGQDILIKAMGFEDSLMVYKPDWDFNTLNEMKVGFGYWVEVSDDGVLEYFPIFADQGSGNKPFRITESASRTNDIATAPDWVNLYSSALKIDGQLAPTGAELVAHNSKGVKVGRGVTFGEGKFGFMPVYADGVILKTGDEFYLSVDGRETRERFLWSGGAARIEVKILTYAAGPGDLPEEYSLSQNYPNPFNPVTNIKFTLPEAVDVTLEVFNTLGRKVATLVDSRLNGGEHIIPWDSHDSSGRPVASGIYLYRLTAGSFTETRKMILLK